MLRRHSLVALNHLRAAQQQRQVAAASLPLSAAEGIRRSILDALEGQRRRRGFGSQQNGPMSPTRPALMLRANSGLLAPSSSSSSSVLGIAKVSANTSLISQTREKTFQKAYAAEQQLTTELTFESIKRRAMRATVAYSRMYGGGEGGGGGGADQATELPPFMVEIRIPMSANNNNNSNNTTPNGGSDERDAACRVVTNSPLIARWLLDEFRSHGKALIWDSKQLPTVELGAAANTTAAAKKTKKTVIKSYLHVHVNAEGRFVAEAMAGKKSTPSTASGGAGAGKTSRHGAADGADGADGNNPYAASLASPAIGLHRSLDIPSVWNFMPNISENLKLQHAAAAEQLHRRDRLIQSEDGGLLELAKARFAQHTLAKRQRSAHRRRTLQQIYNKHVNKATERAEGFLYDKTTGKRRDNPKAAASGGDSSPMLSQKTLGQIEAYLSETGPGAGAADEEEAYQRFERFTRNLDVLAAGGGGAADDGLSSGGTLVDANGEFDGYHIPGGLKYVDHMYGGRDAIVGQTHHSALQGANSYLQGQAVRESMRDIAKRMEQEQYLTNRCSGISVGLRGAAHTLLGAGSTTSASHRLGTSAARGAGEGLGLTGGMGSSSAAEANAVDKMLDPSAAYRSASASHHQQHKRSKMDAVLGTGSSGNTKHSGRSRKATTDAPSGALSSTALVNTVVPSMTFSMTHAKHFKDPTATLLAGKAGRYFWASVPLSDGGFVASWTQPKGATGSPLYQKERQLADMVSRSTAEFGEMGSKGGGSGAGGRYYLGEYGKRSNYEAMDDGTGVVDPRKVAMAAAGDGPDSGGRDSSSYRLSAKSDLFNYLQLPQHKQGPTLCFLNKKRTESVVLVDVDPHTNSESIPRAANLLASKRDQQNGTNGGGSGAAPMELLTMNQRILKYMHRDVVASDTLKGGFDLSYLSALSVSPSSSAGSQNTDAKKRNSGAAYDSSSPLGSIYGDENDEDADGFMRGGGDDFSNAGGSRDGASSSSSSSRYASGRWSPESHDHFKRLRQDILRQLEAVLVASIVPATSAVWCGGSGITFANNENETVDNVVGNGSSAEALVFVGPPGSGKTTMALHCLAAATATATPLNAKLLSCDSFCVVPSTENAAAEEDDAGGDDDYVPRLGVVGLPLNPTLGLGSLMGTLLPNPLLERVLLSTDRNKSLVAGVEEGANKQMGRKSHCSSLDPLSDYFYNDASLSLNSTATPTAAAVLHHGLKRRLSDAALVQETASRILAQQIIANGEEALWSWDKRYGNLAVGLLGGSGGAASEVSGRAMIAAQRGLVPDEARYDCFVTEQLARDTIPLATSTGTADGTNGNSAASFNPLNVDALVASIRSSGNNKKQRTNNDYDDLSSSSSSSAWNCYADTLRYVIVLNWTRLPPTHSSSSSAPTGTFIRKVTDADEVERLLGIELIQKQLDRVSGDAEGSGITSTSAAAGGVDTSDVAAEVSHRLSSSSSSSPLLRNTAGSIVDDIERAATIVPDVQSVTNALLDSTTNLLSMPVSGQQLLAHLVTSAEVKKAKDNGTLRSGAADDGDVPLATSEGEGAGGGVMSPEAIENRRTARLAITLDALTRFTAFSGLTPSGQLSASAVGDGSRAVGLVKRHLFLDEAAVPPIVFDETDDGGDTTNNGSNCNGGSVVVTALPSMVASTIADCVSIDPPPVEADREGDESTAAAGVSSSSSSPYSGIEVYEVSGVVNMQMVRDFALSLGLKQQQQQQQRN